MNTVNHRHIFRRETGGALVETAFGIFVLLPVLFLLIDVIALVIAQSVNDDIAKQAARYASLCTDSTSAYTAADNYVTGTPYHSASSGLIRNAVIQGDKISYNTSNNNMVQVITQVDCHLPIPVPFGGPSVTTFQAQATEVIVALSPTVN